MATNYEKIVSALKEIRRIQNLIKQGLGRPEEKKEAIRLAKEAATLFTDDILKRKAEKLGGQTEWTMVQKSGHPFLSEKAAEALDPWIALLEEYKEKRKIKAELSSDKVNIQSIVDGEDQILLFTKKGSSEHSHLTIDGGTGEVRIDPKDESPHELIKSIQSTTVELKTGEVVKVTKAGLSFVEPEAPKPDVRAYAAQKDGYFVVEIYNSGDEDLEDFRVIANWTQPEGAQEREIHKFNDVTDYLVMAHPHSLNMLKHGARVYANGIPNISIDKKIKITISCKGMRSGKKVEKSFDLETPNQYK